MVGKYLGPEFTKAAAEALIKTDAGSQLAGNKQFDSLVEEVFGKAVTRPAPPRTQQLGGAEPYVRRFKERFVLDFESSDISSYFWPLWCNSYLVSELVRVREIHGFQSVADIYADCRLVSQSLYDGARRLVFGTPVFATMPASSETGNMRVNVKGKWLSLEPNFTVKILLKDRKPQCFPRSLVTGREISLESRVKAITEQKIDVTSETKSAVSEVSSKEDVSMEKEEKTSSKKSDRVSRRVARSQTLKQRMSARNGDKLPPTRVGGDSGTQHQRHLNKIVASYEKLNNEDHGRHILGRIVETDKDGVLVYYRTGLCRGDWATKRMKLSDVDSAVETAIQLCLDGSIIDSQVNDFIRRLDFVAIYEDDGVDTPREEQGKVKSVRELLEIWRHQVKSKKKKEANLILKKVLEGQQELPLGTNFVFDNICRFQSNFILRDVPEIFKDDSENEEEFKAWCENLRESRKVLKVGNDGYGSTKVCEAQSNFVCDRGRPKYRDNQELKVEDIEAMQQQSLNMSVSKETMETVVQDNWIAGVDNDILESDDIVQVMEVSDESFEKLNVLLEMESDDKTVGLCFSFEKDEGGDFTTLKGTNLDDPNTRDPQHKDYVPKDAREFRKATHPAVIEEFTKVIKKEEEGLEKNLIGEIVPITESFGPGKVVRPMKLVLVRKSCGKAKARITFAGFNRKLDSTEKRSGMLRPITFRLLMMRIQWYCLHCATFDVSQAFLIPPLRDEHKDKFYARLYPGFCWNGKEVDVTKFCMKLVKPQYGLGESNRYWWKFFDGKLRNEVGLEAN